jgi:hypothetical protein
MADNELWNILNANANGDVPGLLTRIAKALHDNAGVLVHISGAEKVAGGSFKYFT